MRLGGWFRLECWLLGETGRGVLGQKVECKRQIQLDKNGVARGVQSLAVSNARAAASAWHAVL